MRSRRLWVAGFIGLLAVFGFGQLEAWPFTSWYMFSHVEPSVARVASVVAVSPDGTQRPLGAETLPLGLLGHRLIQRLHAATPAERNTVCEALLAAARSRDPASAVRVEERTWHVLDRSGRTPANVRTTVVTTCG